MSRTALCAALLGLLAGCGRDGPTEPAGPANQGDERVAAAELLPESDGLFSRTGDIRVFAGRELFDYINGYGELHLSYNFQVAATADYKLLPGGADAFADVYDMGGPDDAWGIFSIVAPEDDERVEVGAEGENRVRAACSSMSIQFAKGRYYVKAEAFEVGGGIREGLLALAGAIADAIEGASAVPDIVGYLPPEGLVEGSVKVWRTDLALRQFMPLSGEDPLRLPRGALGAAGRYGGRAHWAFVIEYPSEAEAEAALTAYTEAVGGDGASPARRSGSFVAGVWRASTDEDAQRILDSISDRLPRRN